MRYRLAFLPAFLALLTAASGVEKVQFNRDIRPLLSDKCFYCHGPDKNHREADRRLDLREEALKEHEGIRAIVPGKPEASELVTRIFAADPDDVMPPPKAHKDITPAQKDLLKRWIAEGAEYQPHWAYVPLAREIPSLKPGVNPIDAFIQARLAEKGTAPSAEADPATLCRRLLLDLTGLPPTPEEVDAFTRETIRNPQSAIRNLADRLLASPHFGERMASPWLDIVRYADTVGYHGDQNQNAWAYRDWVIDAFNTNKRFDQFTIEQIAGDLLPNPTPAQHLAVSRLGHRRVECGHAVRSIHHRANRRRPAAGLRSINSGTSLLPERAFNRPISSIRNVLLRRCRASRGRRRNSTPNCSPWTHLTVPRSIDSAGV